MDTLGRACDADAQNTPAAPFMDQAICFIGWIGENKRVAAVHRVAFDGDLSGDRGGGGR